MQPAVCNTLNLRAVHVCRCLTDVEGSSFSRRCLAFFALICPAVWLTPSCGVLSQVLDQLRNDGTFDEIKRKVVDELRQQEHLRRASVQLVEASHAMREVGDPQKANRRQLVDRARREVEQKLLAEVSKAAWSLMDRKDGPINQLIGQKVHEALCVVHDDQGKQQAAGPAGPFQR